LPYLPNYLALINVFMNRINMKSCFVIAAILFSSNVIAQTPVVSISGTACVGSTLSGHSSIQPYSIIWQLNGFSMDSAFNSWNISANTVAGKAGGQAGAGTDSLRGAAGIYVYANGNIYVADDQNFRIQKWTIGFNSGSTVAGGVNQGSGLGQLSNAQNIVLNGGYLYVSDKNNNRILRFSAPFAQGNNGVIVAGGLGAGTQHNHLNRPAGISFDASGNLYVCDQGNNRVLKFTPPFASGNNGTIVAGGNGVGNSPKQFYAPYGIYLDASSNLYVSDSGNHRVLKFISGSDSTTNGTLVAGGNGAGSNANQLASPMGIWVDGNKTVYIADMQNNRIQQWLYGAASGITIAGGNGIGAANNQLVNPINIFMDGFNNLFVGDYSNNRVQMITPSITYNHSALSAGLYTIKVTTFAGASNTSAIYSVSDTLRTSASIHNVPAAAICSGDTLHLSINALNAGATPSYQWYKNGNVIVGATQDSLKAYNLNNGDWFNCSVQSSYVCPVLPTYITAADTITVNPLVYPQINVMPNTASDSICAGTQVVFTASYQNQGSHPTFLWKLNGQSAQVPPAFTSYTTDTLRSGDMVTCQLISNAQCLLSNTVFSLPVVMHVDSFVTPAIVTTLLPGDTVCSGDSLFFSEHAINVGTNPMYQWYDNGNLINGISGPSFATLAAPYIGHNIICYVTSSLPCVTSNIVQSDSVHIYGTNYTIFNAIANASKTNLSYAHEPVKFTATTNVNSALVSYQWRKNSVNIAGATADTLVDNTLVDNDAVDYIATTTFSCINVQSIVSNLVLIHAPLQLGNLNNDADGLNVFPNPIKSNFVISGHMNAKDGINNLQINILNAQGLLIENRLCPIKNNTYTENFVIPENLSSGVYFVELKYDNFQQVKRVLVIK